MLEILCFHKYRYRPKIPKNIDDREYSFIWTVHMGYGLLEYRSMKWEASMITDT